MFEKLPEVGDLDKPKLVFFFDEAHLLFNDAPKALLDKIEQVVRLIRSKGVGVYFVTQNPLDVPDKVLAQLGNRVQHALRAFTPRDQKAVRAAAETFRPNPKLDTAKVITELGKGEALVSFLEGNGTPSMVERALIRPPSARVGPVTARGAQGDHRQEPVQGANTIPPIDPEFGVRDPAEARSMAAAQAAAAAAAEERRHSRRRSAACSAALFGGEPHPVRGAAACRTTEVVGQAGGALGRRQGRQRGRPRHRARRARKPRRQRDALSMTRRRTSHVRARSVLARIDADLDASLDRLFRFLSIKSISTDPAYAEDCRAAAVHLATDLSTLDVAAEVHPTDGHPVVFAKSPPAGEIGPAACVFYGHYDVQPVDPLDLWQTPPFEPRIATLPDGRKAIVARGACDDKGQVMTFIEACRAWKAVTGSLPRRRHLPDRGRGGMRLQASAAPGSRPIAASLRADVALVCDTGMWDPKTPAITTALRGLLYEEIKIKAADRDLHSGLFGGAAQNPIRVLAKIIAAIHDHDGRITIPGFYDGVKELPDDGEEGVGRASA